MRCLFPFQAFLAGIALALAAGTSRGDDYFVPSDWPDLQAAIDEAADNGGPENRILLGASPLTGNFTIGPDFDGTHTLTILPDVEAGLPRATLLAAAMNLPVLWMVGVAGTDTGHITVQDLDVLRRDSGSSSDLVVVDGMSHVTIERCRIGLDMQAPTSAGYANLKVLYPIEVVIRNCILFSAIPGGLDRAVDVQNMIDPASSVLLYNNLAADYRLHGVRVNDGGSNPSALVLLRNNVVANSMAVVPEPFGYRSEVDQATVVTSHNVVYATAGAEESLAPGAASIGGGPVTSGISFARPTVIGSFLMTMWTATPPFDANPAFFRLQPAGPLHDSATDWGQTVVDGGPDARDVAVLQDFDRQGRPGGLPAHTDRGPDQVEAAAATDARIGPAATTDSPILVTARPNPSDRIVLHFVAKGEGVLALEVFDAAGRRMARAERPVEAGGTGSWSPPGRLAGMAFYRATLTTRGGQSFAAHGKVALLK